MFPRGTNTRYVHILALGRLQAFDTGLRQRTPQGIGGFDLDAVWGEQQVDRPRGTASDDQGVEAGALKRTRKTASERRIEEESGQWGLGGYAEAAIPRNVRVRHRPHRQDHGVTGIERVDPRLQPIVQKAGGKSVASQVKARKLFVKEIDLTQSGRQVNCEKTSAIAVHEGLRRRSSSRTRGGSASPSMGITRLRRDFSCKEVYSQ